MNVRTQRIAMEALSAFLRPVSLRPSQRFFLDGREIYFLGVSCGNCRCGEASCLEIAVFGPEAPAERAAVAAPRRFDGAVLLRDPRPGPETAEAAGRLPVENGADIEVVEALLPGPAGVGRADLASAGDRSFYVVIV